jgi:hypothetical protein
MEDASPPTLAMSIFPYQEAIICQSQLQINMIKFWASNTPNGQSKVNTTKNTLKS